MLPVWDKHHRLGVSEFPALWWSENRLAQVAVQESVDGFMASALALWLEAFFICRAVL
jgi:hypothetical protein